MKVSLHTISDLCKRLGVLLLLSLFLFNALGYYLVFFAAQHQYRTARFERLKTKNHGEKPEILKFNIKEKPDYHWVKDGEITFAGRLYDVVEQDLQGDTIVFLAYDDTKELKMNADFSDHINTHATDQNKLPKKGTKPDVLKKILKDYLPNQADNHLAIEEDLIDINPGEKPDLYLSVILSLPDNPPEVFNISSVTV